MNTRLVSFASALIFAFCLTSFATTHYVDINGTNPTAPYLDWSTAATNIQDAVDASVDSDLVLVTNGVYATGGRTNGFALTNRVVVTNAITIQSVNGPAYTTIQGFAPSTTNGPSAIRCVWLTNNAALIGFTITGGATLAAGDSINEMSGGGIWCASTNEMVSNCVVVSNACQINGGGAYQTTLLNCALTNNLSESGGGGAYGSVLTNCVVAGNLAFGGGAGAYNSTLYNCTVSGNIAHNPNIFLNAGGGGIESGKAINCLISGNSASDGGGVYLGTAINSAIFDNTAAIAGGIYQGTAVNSTIIGNVATSGTGGLYISSATNCIIYFNSSKIAFTNYDNGSATLDHCCTFPLPSTGTGNITNDPVLASVSHISVDSPCRNKGTAADITGVDIDGEPWQIPPSIGCDELYVDGATGTPIINIVATYTNVPVGYSNTFIADIIGKLQKSIWDFGDGTQATNAPVISHIWPAAGTYTVTLIAFNQSYPFGISNTLTINYYVPQTLYVMTNSSTPIAPYDSWAKAARDIQSAIDIAYTNDVILVSNGLYNTGSRTNIDGSTNRVFAWQPLTLQSVNGPSVTRIDGGGTMRCLFLTNDCSVTGFAVTNGLAPSGPGIFSTSSNNLVSSCLLISNRASANGGALFAGTATNCTFMRNPGNAAADCFLQNCVVGPGNSGQGVLNSLLSNCIVTGNNGGGVSFGSAYNCLIASNTASDGAGAYQSVLVDCMISSNTALSGAGAYRCYATNCLFVGNFAGDGQGGGAEGFALVNCTVVSNHASMGGGGVAAAYVTNCIIYYNNFGSGPTNSANFASLFGAVNCCTFQLPTSGIGNFTNPPLFVNFAGGDFHLQSTSPCINAGNNTAVTTTTDSDGNPRIVGGTVDVGAYEYQTPTSILSYAWAQQYGIPTDGSADFADPDGDGMNNWQEWIAGTIPTNASSVLQLLSPSLINSAGVNVTWQSVTNQTYYLQRAADLSATPAFATIQTNIAGQTGFTTFLDTTATNSDAYFYRIGIQQPYVNPFN